MTTKKKTGKTTNSGTRIKPIKSDSPTVTKRINAVRAMIAQGTKTRRIIQFGIAEWLVTESQIYRYMQVANTLINESYEDQHEPLKKQTLIMYDEIIQKAFSMNDLDLVIKTLGERNKLIGLNAPSKIDLSSKISLENAIEEGDKQLREKIQSGRADPKSRK